MKNKKIYIIFAVCLLMLVFVGIAVSKKPQTEDTVGGYKSGPRVKVEKVTKKDIKTKISSSGKLEAAETKTIYLDAANKVVTIHKEVGDIVQKGDLILTLDTETEIKVEKEIEGLELQLKAAKEGLDQLVNGGSKQQVLEAETALAKIENTIVEAKANLEQQKVKIENFEKDLGVQKKELSVQEELLAEGLTSEKAKEDVETTIIKLEQSIHQTKKDIEAIENTIEVTTLQKESAQYNLDILLNKVVDSTKKQSISAQESRIKDIETLIFNSTNTLNKTSTEIVAPISGVITVGPSEEGVSISPGTPLITIVDPSKLLITCDISPYYAADLKTGLTAEIKYTGSKTIEVAGEVTKVSPIATSKQSASGEVAAIPVEVEVKEPGDVIRPGFSVDVKIITETRENVCVIPILATVEDDDESTYVYVVKEDGSLEKRTVVQGLSDGLYTEVEGLEEGELIVSSPTDYLKDVTKVSYEKIGDVQ